MNKKIIWKLTIIDLVIISMVIMIMAYAISYFSPRAELGSSRTKKIQYTYETTNVSESFTRQIKEGLNLYNSSRNHYVGTIVSYEVLPYEVRVPDLQNGVFRQQVLEDQWIVRMVVSAEAFDEPYHFRVTQESIKVGAVFPIKGRGFASYGAVIALEEVE